MTNIFGGAEKKTIQFVVNTLYKKKKKKNQMIEYKNKILSAFKNRQRSKEHWPNMLFQSILKEFSFYLYYRRVMFLETSFYSYVLRFLNKFSIHVLIKKLDFKCDGSLHSIFCRFLQTFVYHKIWTLRRFFYKVKHFNMDCIVNKYIFFNLYVHSHLKYTHLIKSSLKYI